MLILSRRLGESIVIDGETTVRVVEIRGGKVRLGINAPDGVPVHRREVWLELCKIGRRDIRSRQAAPHNSE